MERLGADQARPDVRPPRLCQGSLDAEGNAGDPNERKVASWRRVALCAAGWRDSSATTRNQRAASKNHSSTVPRRRLEVELSRELHDPHVAVCRGDRARVRRSECRHRVAEVHAVEDVENFDARFELLPRTRSRCVTAPCRRSGIPVPGSILWDVFPHRPGVF